MKKIAVFTTNILLFLVFGTCVQGQEVTNLNHFQYINVPPIKYSIVNSKTGNLTTEYDIYGIGEIIIKRLNAIGIEVLQSSGPNQDALRKDCRIGHCEVYHISELDPEIIDGIFIEFTDCNYQNVYSCRAKVNSMAAKRVTVAIAAGKGPIQAATNAALSEISEFNYTYDLENPIEKIDLQQSDMDRKEIISHFKSGENEFDPIEGVYVSIDVDAYFIELGIIKNGENFDMIVMESEDDRWKPGTIRGRIVEQKNYVYSGYYFITKDYKISLEIGHPSGRIYPFSFIDQSTNENFTIEFKKKMPK